MEKNGKNEGNMYEFPLAPATIFDDVFRTMAQKLPQLLIPLVNEVFGTAYLENEDFEQLRNEHYEQYGKIITDSILRIQNHLYHIECQSTKDGNMAVRMMEYDFAIALEHSWSNEEGIFELEFPESCVLYIRNHRDMPEVHKTKIRFSNGHEVLYEVPIIMAQDYSIECMFEKNLLILLPYHILRYEHFLKTDGRDEKKIQVILEDYRSILEKLEEYTNVEERSKLYVEMIKLIEEIADYIISEKNPVKERLGELMGGKVLKLRSEELLEQGMEQGENKKARIAILNLFHDGMTIEKIARMVDETVETVEEILLEEKLLEK